ncbi:MAG: type II methionyl aminopeptidase [Nanoarchaeota archaeon]|nr:type II methionyl aminopeptidase [Nanoarchaeota archaeon]
MNKNEIEKILKAGKITKEVREYARKIIKPNMQLLEIAEKIEDKIKELEGKPAFPTNLSIDEIAAHNTPNYDDKTKARGLLKVDFGVHIDGWTADNAFTIDLEKSQENKKLITASEKALEKAINLIKQNKDKTIMSEIGKTIQEEIESHTGLTPIANLSGHSIEAYDLHAGKTIPNVTNSSTSQIGEGLFAIEPFSTTGNGRVKDGRQSGIYQVVNQKNTRSPLGREILSFIVDEYGTLPFCSRWLIKKFGTRCLIALKQLEQENVLHQYAQLIEVSEAKVAQTEHTILIHDGKAIVIDE